MGKKKKTEKIDSLEQEASEEARLGLLIATWKARNELYKELFGDYAYVSPDSYAEPTKEVLRRISKLKVGGATQTFEPADLDDDSQHLAVLAYAPDPLRPYWTYVTAGLCSPWSQDEPGEVSGLGCELMIKAPVDALWPAQILRSIAFYIFNHAGGVSPGVRIGLNAPITVDTDSELRNLMVWYADEAPDGWYQLPAGGFGVFCVIGITEDECRYAESIEEYGTWCVQETLRQVGHGQLSDPERSSIMQRPNIDSLLSNVKAFAEKFRADPIVDDGT